MTGSKRVRVTEPFQSSRLGSYGDHGTALRHNIRAILGGAIPVTSNPVAGSVGTKTYLSAPDRRHLELEVVDSSPVHLTESKSLWFRL